MILLDGKTAAAEIRQELRKSIEEQVRKGIRPPGLAVILVGDDPASQIYVRNKQKACAEAGIVSIPYFLPADAGKAEILELIGSLNHREDVDGILLQLPLPGHLNTDDCLMAIEPDKDVDGFHPVNMGKLVLGLPGLRPCTPAGMIELLARHEISLAGKKAVVVGRSNIVGKPLAQLLASRGHNATVTLCHTGTQNLAEECRRADVLFLAMGRPGAITADMVRDGCVVVDAGINRTSGGICGDADFAEVSKKAAAITPVPGGVGPMTIAMLLKNTTDAWLKNIAGQSGQQYGKNASEAGPPA